MEPRHIDVYRGDELIAALDCGLGGVYHGDLGLQVHRLVDTPHWVTNPWTGERAYAPPDNRPDWWASAILSAGLERLGCRPVARGLPAARRA